MSASLADPAGVIARLISGRAQKALVFCASAHKSDTPFMFTRVTLPVLLLGLSLFHFHTHDSLAAKAKATPSPSATPAASATPVPPKPSKPIVDQTAQVIIFGYHRFVNKVRHPDT